MCLFCARVVVNHSSAQHLHSDQPNFGVGCSHAGLALLLTLLPESASSPWTALYTGTSDHLRDVTFVDR
eukprot:942876-Pyramimonas_sp.AAC.1